MRVIIAIKQVRMVEENSQSENVFDLCVNFFITSFLCSTSSIAQGERAIIVIASSLVWCGVVVKKTEKKTHKNLQEGSNRFYLLFVLADGFRRGNFFLNYIAAN